MHKIKVETIPPVRQEDIERSILLKWLLHQLARPDRLTHPELTIH